MYVCVCTNVRTHAVSSLSTPLYIILIISERNVRILGCTYASSAIAACLSSRSPFITDAAKVSLSLSVRYYRALYILFLFLFMFLSYLNDHRKNSCSEVCYIDLKYLLFIRLPFTRPSPLSHFRSPSSYSPCSFLRFLYSLTFILILFIFLLITFLLFLFLLIIIIIIIFLLTPLHYIIPFR